MLVDAEPLGNFRYRITPLRDLRHRITLELVAEIHITRQRRLSSKLGYRASRNLGAVHNCIHPIRAPACAKIVFLTGFRTEEVFKLP
jgi:hypothetical protein